QVLPVHFHHLGVVVLEHDRARPQGVELARVADRPLSCRVPVREIELGGPADARVPLANLVDLALRAPPSRASITYRCPTLRPGSNRKLAIRLPMVAYNITPPPPPPSPITQPRCRLPHQRPDPSR